MPGHDFNLPADLEGLDELAYNLWWSWTPRAQSLFSRIDSGDVDAASQPDPGAARHRLGAAGPS